MKKTFIMSCGDPTERDIIPVNEPLLNGREKEYLCECIDSGWISSDGPFVKQFEKQFSSYFKRSFGIAVCNGTAALEAALYALGIEVGDEVIMPAFTIISCAIACLRLGAVPILVDIEPDTWTMDVAQIESKITDKTKVIMPVHIYGHTVQMDEIFRLKEKFDITILEDFAEAHGAEYHSEYFDSKWLQCGSMGDVSATSFYANKILTTGEGGIITTDDPEMALRAQKYRNLCFETDTRFLHNEIGYNFRMTNLQAAVGLAQMERIEEFVQRKRLIGDYYRKRIRDIPGVRFAMEKQWARTVYWMYAVEIHPSAGVDAETVRRKMNEVGIGTRPFFLGLHSQPALLKLDLGIDQDGFPKTDHAYRYGFYLPSSLTLNEAKVDFICSKLYDIMVNGNANF